MLVSMLLAAGLVAAPPPKVTMAGRRIAPIGCPAEGALMTRNADPALLLRPQDRRGDRGAQALESLPPANLELAVARSVGGCAISSVVRENVQGDGRFTPTR